MKKVVIDKFIPFEGNPFEGVAEIERLAPADINADTVRDADALIVRTRTRCDASLLENSRVGIVATATIGTDHLDFPYLASRGIKTVSAPGCNAPAVAQYVFASIFSMGLGDPGMRLGIVGLGHVGSIVASWALNFGMDVYACDIPRQSREHGWNPAAPLTAGDIPFRSLEEIARKCDAVTFHTPLTRSGDCPTFHLLDRDFLSVAPKALVVNAAAGRGTRGLRRTSTPVPHIHAAYSRLLHRREKTRHGRNLQCRSGVSGERPQNRPRSGSDCAGGGVAPGCDGFLRPPGRQYSPKVGPLLL